MSKSCASQVQVMLKSCTTHAKVLCKLYANCVQLKCSLGQVIGKSFKNLHVSLGFNSRYCRSVHVTFIKE